MNAWMGETVKRIVEAQTGVTRVVVQFQGQAQWRDHRKQVALVV